MNKSLIYFILAGILVIALSTLLLFLRNPEDTWIKDERGIWVKHGVPSSIPNEVKKQQNAVNSAINLYNEKKQQGMNFSSQCLGTISDYAIDIVHVPRTQEDNLEENQCNDYKTGKVSHFIELDKEGNVVRIIN